ncbi:ATP-binding protein [Algoriphagus sp.]|uniref:ATP-binding protein n=1 Tax=Algoriphagus sp. TaxID=1872435 RepID=UPI00260FB6C2|nr:ATP-binding protein [Algoriphagus sp.]
MTLSSTKAKEARKLYDRYWKSYQNGDLETFASTLDDTFEMIGTSESEVCHSKTDGIEFLKAQLDEIVGKVEMRNRQIEVVPVDQLMLINEQCDIYVWSESVWTFYSKIRISTFLRETEAGWKVTQQHGSLPDMRVQEGETLALEKISKENLELRDAVKRRTAELENKNRELEIEAALERVRAQTMAMHSSEDVGKCVVKMFSELTALGVDEGTRFGIGILNHYNENNQLWTARKTGEEVNMHIGNIDMAWHPMLKQARQAWLEQVPFHKYVLEGEDLLNYYRMLNQAPDYKIQIPIEKLPEREIQHCFIFEHGFFYAFSPREFQPELIHITKRFSALFEQTYRRYLDLVRAEAQAREAEIELALERVRARTMAMHHSEELSDAGNLLFQQLKLLGIQLETSWLWFIDPDTDLVEIWTTHENKLAKPIRIDPEKLLTVQKEVEAWKNKVPTLKLKIQESEAVKAIKEFFGIEISHPEDAEHFHLLQSRHKYGFLGLGTWNEATEIEIKLYSRFAKVFEQTYTRFLDLQKAEAQAKEAQIELSLERIRSQVTAMQESSDLLDIVVTMRTEFVKLGHEAQYFWHMRWLPERYDKAMTSGDGTKIGMVMRLPRHIHGDIPLVADWEKSKKPTLVLAMEVETAVDYIHKMITLGDFEQVDPQALTLDDIRHISGLTFVMARTTHGEIGYSLPGVVIAPPKNAVDTLIRFAGVFDLAYKRFEDLKSAERQHHEAQIELALERVRARTMAMQKSQELAEASSLLFQQMEALGVSTYSSGFTIWDEDQDELISWMCNADGSMNPPFRMPIEEDKWHKEQYDSWKKGDDFIVKNLNGEEMQSYFRYLRSFPLLDEAFEKSIAAGHPMPEKQVHHVANFSHGNLLFISLEPYPKAHELFKRFAKVFEQTYTRFLDLQKAEKQAREAEIQLALERVRARSLAMHRSEELADISMELVKQVQTLGMESWFCAFNIYDDDPRGSVEWGSNGKGTFPQYRTPREGVFLRYFEAGQRGETLLVNEIREEACPAHYEYLCSLPGVGEQLLQMKAAGIPFPTSQIDHVAFFKYGYVLFITYEPAPESHDIFKRFAKVFEQSYTRFLDLQKAEAQAREAQIETGLERVRSKSLAMHKTAELQRVIHTVHQELINLNISISGGSFIVINSEIDHEIQCWGSGGTADTFDRVQIPHFEKPFYTHILTRLKGDPGFFTEEYTQEEKIEFFTFLFQHEPWSKLSAKEKKHTLSASGGYTRSCAVAKHTSIFIINHFGEKFSEAENVILRRFGKVFEQSYTRFLDLQKAEAQAREAQVNLAVERVRARALAMFKSEEILEVVNKLREEIMGLDIPHVTAATIHLQEPDGKYRAWDLTSIGEEENELEISLDIRWRREDTHPDFFMREVWDRTEDYFVVIQGNDRFKHTVSWLRQYGYSKQADDFLAFLASSSLEKGYHPTVPLQKGRMTIDVLEPPVAEVESILKKMAGAFDLAYKRFEDLQKAEEQAREAQIEAALERVRSRTMAMQSSDELSEAATEMFRQIKGLGLKPWSCGFNIFNEDKTVISQWVSSADGRPIEPFDTPTSKDVFKQIVEHSEQDELLYIQKMEGKKLENTYKYMASLPTLDNIFAELDAAGIALPKSQVDHVAYFKHGYLMFITYEETPEFHSIFKRFAKVFEQTYTRFLDLKKAEAQAREAKIETALEKVRSRSMGMQSSEELPEVANLMFLEIQALGIHAWSCGYCILEEDRRSSTCIMSSEGTIQKPFLLPHFGEPSFEEWDDFVQSDESFFVQELKDKGIKSHYDFMTSLPQLKATFQDFKDAGLSLPTYQINHLCKFTHGFLLFITYESVLEAHQIFKRFTNVFDQTYTRFLDLQKAEAQAQEARIEAALERVRSRTMGMQKAEELGEVATVLFSELNSLVDNLWTCGFVLCKQNRQEDEWWLSLNNGLIQPFSLPNVGDYAHESLYQGWQLGEAYRTVTLENEKLSEHYDWLMGIPIAKKIFEEMESSGIPRPNWQRLHAAYFKTGYLVIITEVPCEEEDIFKRFAQVFDLTYTRFLDLQKAEKQAREAQIEAALERIRSRAVAMQSSDELKEVAMEIRTQMGLLGQRDLEVCAIHLYEEHDHDFESWGALQIEGREHLVLSQSLFPKSGKLIIDEMMDRYGSDQDEYVLLNAGKKAEEWFDLLKQNAPETYSYILKSIGNLPVAEMRAYWAIADFSGGSLVMVSYSFPDADSRSLLRRTANVFGLAYKRFKDLRVAEISAKAAMRQASLDRVRADISSMRHTNDLDRITPLIFKELTVLGVPFIRCGIFIINEKQKLVEAYLSSPEGKSLGVLRLPYKASELTYQTVMAWRKGEILRQHWNQEDFIQWIKQLMEQDQIQDSNTYQGTAAPPESLDLHFVPFAQGMLYVGAVNPLKENELELVQALAKAFSIAYARYEDFVKLERAKAEVESAMSELKATQSQLVQQEKLASLGQLTAGIAHEIKNPLNFVNNFSELSSELIDEAFAELEKLESSEEKEEIIAILQDVKGNLSKVHEHGTRANGIVTSMLQHSRGGSGKMETTDLNALTKEYVNLSFHGMRAGKNPIEVDIILELDPNIKEVSLIKEDFSRVIINLCNNAFDAMRQKSLQGFESLGGLKPFQPKLTVRTKSQKNQVFIEVVDNGPGIPDEIKDKILQPFFTTKKGTEGTGLGLSITNDIVKAHGGQLEIKSSPGEGSTFIILLPI